MNNKDKGKTPYQGPRRVWGEFKCSKCGESWISYHSRANMAQECSSCHIDIYPHTQRPLQKPDGFLDDDDIDMFLFRIKLQHTCEECKKLGKMCRRHYSRY